MEKPVTLKVAIEGNPWMSTGNFERLALPRFPASSSSILALADRLKRHQLTKSPYPDDFFVLGTPHRQFFDPNQIGLNNRSIALVASSSLLVWGSLRALGYEGFTAVLYGGGMGGIVAFQLHEDSETQTRSGLLGKADPVLPSLQRRLNAVYLQDLCSSWNDFKPERIESWTYEKRLALEPLIDQCVSIGQHLIELEFSLPKVEGKNKTSEWQCARYTLTVASYYASEFQEELRRLAASQTWPKDSEASLALERLAIAKAKYLHIEGILIGAPKEQMGERVRLDVMATLETSIEGEIDRPWPLSTH